jgi:hypothetical protein
LTLAAAAVAPAWGATVVTDSSTLGTTNLATSGPKSLTSGGVTS